MNISDLLNKTLFSFTMLLVLTLPGCNSSEPEEFYAEDVIIVDNIELNEWAADPVNIDSVYIKGDILFIRVQYSGGCQDHIFKLIIPRAIEKTNPPSVTILLSHDSNDDTCEAWLTRDLKFNLQEYKYYLRSSYGSNTAILKFYNSELSVLYF